LFGKFSDRLKEIEDIINERNKNSNLRNRIGRGLGPRLMSFSFPRLKKKFSVVAK
jgi:hypothetical protein